MVNAVRGAVQDYNVGKERNYAHLNGKDENKIFSAKSVEIDEFSNSFDKMQLGNSNYG
jgi:hypothetical protein